MSTKAKIITGYLVIGLIIAIYLATMGSNSSRGFAYALGQGLIWPAVIFPGVGQALGGIVILAFVAAVAFL